MRSFSQALPAAAMCVALSACGPGSTETASLRLSPLKASFTGASERAVIKLIAQNADGTPGGGTVQLTSTVGHFVDDTIALVEGEATATFVCVPDEEPACVGAIKLEGAWGAVQSTTQLLGLSSATANTVTWEVVPTGVASTALTLERSPTGEVWAAGEDGMVLHLAGRTWERLDSGVAVTLRALAFSADGSPVAAGAGGTLVRWSQGAPHALSLGAADLTAVAVDANGVIYTGDADGQITAYDVARGLLTASAALGSPIKALVVSGDGLYAVTATSLSRFDGASWTQETAPFTGTLLTARPGTDALLLGGERQGVSSTSGVLAEGLSPDWSTTQLNAPVQSIAEVPGAAERFVLTDDGLFRQLDQQPWQPVPCPSRGAAIVSRGPSDLVLVGPPGISLLRVP